MINIKLRLECIVAALVIADMQACDKEQAQFPRSLEPYLANSSLLSMPLWSLSRFRY